jgi:hypothetical protein
MKYSSLFRKTIFISSLMAVTPISTMSIGPGLELSITPDQTCELTMKTILNHKITPILDIELKLNSFTNIKEKNGLSNRFSYFSLDGEGNIDKLNGKGENVEIFLDLEYFFEQYEYSRSHFYFVLDTEKPESLILGVRSDSFKASGEKATGSVAIDGGLSQLASRYRKLEGDGKNFKGLIGGNISVDTEDQLVFDFNKNGYNFAIDKKDAVGELDDDLIEYIEQTLYNLLKKGMVERS